MPIVPRNRDVRAVSGQVSGAVKACLPTLFLLQLFANLVKLLKENRFGKAISRRKIWAKKIPNPINSGKVIQICGRFVRDSGPVRCRVAMRYVRNCFLKASPSTCGAVYVANEF